MVNNIHDALFRETMSHKDVAADFMRQYLPEAVVRHVRLETLAICKDTFVAPDQTMHHSDLLYEVRLSGDRPAYVYFLFEHKSTPDRFVALQVLRYMLEIWELARKQRKARRILPLIIPIVVYHGKTRQRAVHLGELVDLPDAGFKAYVPDFALAFHDFSPGSEERIKGSIILRLLLTCFRAKNDPRAIEHLLDIYRVLSELDDDEPSLRWVQVIFRYLTQTMDIEENVMHDAAEMLLSSTKKGTIMTLAERLLHRGKQEGRQEGRLLLLQRQLTKRFGQDVLDIRVQERLRTATPEQLDLWAERILDARAFEEVFSDLPEDPS
jgi:predicted transposase/invertase (TIGR01784 family)